MARRRKGRDVHGWLVLDKPKGATSTAMVTAARRTFDAKKAGHAGALDPLATGILPIAFGEATKTVPFAMDATKEYRFALRWGEERASDDLEGEVTARADHRPSPTEIGAALPRFIGEVMQAPPAFSAIKVEGRRAYDLAREGASVELRARRVRIDALELLETPDRDHAVFRMTCGKGTYVRSLARDLGRALGSRACVASLRRTRVGRFSEASAISLDKLPELRDKAAGADALLAVETALDDIPALAVTEAEARDLAEGRAVFAAGWPPTSPDGTAYATAKGRLIALGRVEGRVFQPTRVFNITAGH